MIFIACTFLISYSPATGTPLAVSRLVPRMIELISSSFGDPGRLYPGVDLAPGNRVILEHSCYLKERNAATLKNICKLRDRARLAPREPLTRHPATILQTVERGIIDSCSWCKI